MGGEIAAVAGSIRRSFSLGGYRHPRKVRAPVGPGLGNTQVPQGNGKCHRK